MAAVTFTVNGGSVEVTADPATPLLDVLRNHLGLIGAKFGCGLEQCGCCMVLVDGSPEKSCGKSLESVAGKQILTIEGLGTPREAAPAATGLSRRAGRAVRLLPCRDPGLGQGAARPEPGAEPRRDRRRARRQHLPLRPHHRILRAVERGRRADARGSGCMSSAPAAALPPLLAANPRLDQWVAFRRTGRVTVSTGRVEIGQGVLTAMLQIAAEELDVAPDAHRAADRRHRADPERGLYRRQPVDPVRRRRVAAGLRRGAGAVSRPCRRPRSAMSATISRSATARSSIRRTDRAGLLVAGRRGRSWPPSDRRCADQEGGRLRHRRAERSARRSRRQSVRRGGLRPRHGAWTACCMPASCASRAAARRLPRSTRRRSAAPPRARIEIVRDGNFVAIVGADETVVEAAAAVAPSHVRWDGVEPISPFQEEARWLLQQPSIDRVVGAPPPEAPVPGASRREATYTRMYLAHASIAPSCGVAVFRDGRLEVWTHSQGVYPLRAALARTLKLDPAAISVRHAQGPGCYGHNGADDAAADAAVVAMRRPGNAGPGALAARGGVRVRAGQPGDGDDRAAPRSSGRGGPTDWTTEIWSGRHSSRPGGGGNLLAAEALPDPPPAPPAVEWLGAARRRHPQRRAALRFPGKAHRASPDRRDAGADLVAARARRDAERVRDRIVRSTSWPPRPARTRSPTGCRCWPTARARGHRAGGAR